MNRVRHVDGLKAVVLAAGYGKRLMPLTVNRSKHVLPLAGKPLIMHIVESIVNAGITDIGILLGYRSEAVVNIFKKIDTSRLKCIYQRDIAGTGAALKDCRDFLTDEDFFLVVYGDITITGDVLKELINFFWERKVDGVLAAVETEGQGAYGIVEVQEGLLVRIGEKEMGRGPVNAGIYILGKRIFNVLEGVKPSVRGEIELTDALNSFVAEGGKIGVKLFGKGWWFDIGKPYDYLAANHTYLRKLYKNSIDIGKNATVGNNVYLHGPVYIGPDVAIGDNCVIWGPAMVCEGSKIGDWSVVKGSVVLEKCMIGPRSNINDSIICENSSFKEGVRVLSKGFPAYISPPGTYAIQRLYI